MAILNYTTKIESIKTIGEIQSILAKHGASRITTDFKQGIPVSVSFSIDLNGRHVSFRLPCNYEGVYLSMKKNGTKVPKSLQTKEQAMRVSWRILKDWVEAQMAVIESQLCTVIQVFLPYAITDNGETFYDRINGGDDKVLANI